MKALVCRSLSAGLDGLAFETVSLPPPGPGQVRIRLHAAAVNFPDVLMVQGLYQHKPQLPFTPGMEGAGEIVAVGEEVEALAPGMRVMVSALGCFAEEVQAEAARVRAIPKGVDDAVAAAFTAAYLTAYVGLVRRAAIGQGEWLLVHGAAGGVGLAAVDLARVLGANVIATASTPDKRRFLEDYGVEHVLAPDGFRDSVKALTGGRGADVIYDPVGGDVFDESTHCIAFGGRLVAVGFAGGRIPVLPVNLALIKGFSLMGLRAGEYGRRFPQQGRENIAAIDALLAQGKLKPHVGARLPLDKAVDAMRLLSSRQAIGKVVLEC
ncbi:MAG: NADPH:quinone oxidoreductase family protein [Alphaproteobacteria bacterium]|nr:NADPH:quinone oxidoreductase family protein [Alphaproteobacteria bacterium]MBV9694878.1 NADPH:quinone oxidoreductase family protein [Alphaproteobacteria bacterium]